ncbi:conserved hypothetical protein [Thermosinus carboxydivorans Nor1]|uniref:Cytoplasmic chaperone TorD family protein n=1 Tax=Thermosinus carboxydivorans Nor1 TaxID=401526 RepID=A1HUC8_9FIRM|nr:molecular chaperone TorD family protein [Thermosinus carboxydivorans]EAX46366.1 conserved hypothetical protein [Thermosinus carboxydivorans Nor1]
MNKQEYRIGLYVLFAEMLKEPTEEFAQELPDMVQYCHEAFAALGYNIPLAAYQGWGRWADDVQALKDAYLRAFVFPPDRRLVPVESIYRQWTFDETAEVPIAKEKGYLMSDAALHMLELYKQYGLEIPREFRSMPDHLCLELEFAAFLLEKESPTRQAVYIREHLDWVGDLCQDAFSLEIPQFYREVVYVISLFLEHELQAVAEAS